MTRFRNLLTTIVRTNAPPPKSDLDSIYYDLRVALYGGYVSDWSNRESELSARISSRSAQLNDALDVLGALALSTDLDSGPLLDKAILLRDSGRLDAAEEVLMIAAHRIEEQADDDEGEQAEADGAWVLACEAALKNGRLLTALTLASRCSSPTKRGKLAESVRSAIQRRLGEPT